LREIDSQPIKIEDTFSQTMLQAKLRTHNSMKITKALLSTLTAVFLFHTGMHFSHAEEITSDANANDLLPEISTAIM